jgi:uncharacterized protein involved in response to NO
MHAMQSAVTKLRIEGALYGSLLILYVWFLARHNPFAATKKSVTTILLLPLLFLLAQTLKPTLPVWGVFVLIFGFIWINNLSEWIHWSNLLPDQRDNVLALLYPTLVVIATGWLRLSNRDR